MSSGARRRETRGVLGIFHEILSDGGLQQFSRNASLALVELAERTGRDYGLLSRGDPRGANEVVVHGRRLRVRGFGGRKASFARAAVAAASRADVVLLGHPYLAALVPALRAANPRLGAYVAAHGIDVWQTLSFPRRLGLRAAAGVVAVSADTARRVVERQGVDATRVAVVPNALDPGFLAATDGRAAARAPVVLTVSRLAAAEAYKGVDAVIATLPELRRRVPWTRYEVVGDGDDRPRLERLAAELGVDDAVSFLGRVSRERLLEAYRSCRVFAMPSVAEGFGIVFLEAMAFGKPVVAARAGGAPEVVVDGETGMLVEPGDEAALADALAAVLTDDELAARLGAAGRAAVVERYSFAKYRDRLLAILAGDRPR